MYIANYSIEIYVYFIRFNSTHNSSVKTYLVETLEDKYSPDTYTPKKINSKSQSHMYVHCRSSAMVIL